MAASISMSSRAEVTGEAALMDRIYRRQRHVYDVTRKYYLLGRDRTALFGDVEERFEQHSPLRPAACDATGLVGAG